MNPTNKIPIELGSLQITLLLPLWGRSVEARKKHPGLVDSTATAIIDKIDYDFSTIAKNIHPVTQFEWIVRSLHIDRTIREFLNAHPKGTIINIGCGLDTTFDRVDNASLFWYDLDLPDVIKLRKQFICENERRKFISCSFLDDRWLNELHVEDGVLFMAAGVMYYIEESEIKSIFGKMAAKFPGSELVFDAASPLGVTVANKQVIQGSGLGEKSFLKWGMRNAAEISKWNDQIEVIREYPMYRNTMKGLNLKNRVAAWMSDRYKIMYMVHLRLGRCR